MNSADNTWEKLIRCYLREKDLPAEWRTRKPEPADFSLEGIALNKLYHDKLAYERQREERLSKLKEQARELNAIKKDDRRITILTWSKRVSLAVMIVFLAYMMMILYGEEYDLYMCILLGGLFVGAVGVNIRVQAMLRKEKQEKGDALADQKLAVQIGEFEEEAAYERLEDYARACAAWQKRR